MYIFSVGNSLLYVYVFERSFKLTVRWNTHV